MVKVKQLFVALCTHSKDLVEGRAEGGVWGGVHWCLAGEFAVKLAHVFCPTLKKKKKTSQGKEQKKNLRDKNKKKKKKKKKKKNSGKEKKISGKEKKTISGKEQKKKKTISGKKKTISRKEQKNNNLRKRTKKKKNLRERTKHGTTHGDKSRTSASSVGTSTDQTWDEAPTTSTSQN